VICLSKNLTDEYINKFAHGADLEIYDYDRALDFDKPILIRSLGKRKLIKECWKLGKTFYYMDSGYVGNFPGQLNPLGYKLWHRIVKNDLQHNKIIDRPDDRWKALNYEIKPMNKSGGHILVVAPSEKPCKFYGIDKNKWIEDTVKEIKKHTDRKVFVREKQDREIRIKHTIFEQLQNCHAMVTYQSIAAVESVLHGVPAFTMAPTAADPVCDKDLSLLETPTYQEYDKVYKWACHLAYGQFHVNEMKTGVAYKLLMDDEK